MTPCHMTKNIVTKENKQELTLHKTNNFLQK